MQLGGLFAPFTAIAAFHECKFHSCAEFIGCVSSRKWCVCGGEGGKKEIPHTHTRQARWRVPKVFAERKLTLHYNNTATTCALKSAPPNEFSVCITVSCHYILTGGGNLFQRTMPRTHNAQYTYSIMLMFSFDTSYLHHAHFPRPLHRKPPRQADVQSVHHAGGALRERLAHYDMREWQHDARALAQSAGQRDRGQKGPTARGGHAGR